MKDESKRQCLFRLIDFQRKKSMLLFFSKVLSVEIFIILSLPRRIFFKVKTLF